MRMNSEGSPFRSTGLKGVFSATPRLRPRKPGRGGILLMAAVIFSLLTAPLSWAQDTPPAEGHGYDVPKLCREAEKQYKNKKDRDVDRLVEIFQVFDDIYPRATARERKMMLRTLRKGFDIQPFPKNSRFLVTAAACFADMGKAGLDAMLYALKRKTLVRRTDRDRDALDMEKQKVEETLILAMGFNGDPRALKPLLQYLESRDAYRVNAACRALARFSTLPLDRRKALVGKMIQVYLRITRESEAKGEDSKAYDLLLTVEVQFNEALNRLTLRSFESAPQWKTWFEVNKDKKKW